SKQGLREAAEAGQDPSRISLTAKKNILIGLPFLMTDELVPCFLGKKWSILEAAKGVEFISCDTPLSIFELTPRGTSIIGPGTGRPGAQLTLPLSPSRALRLSLCDVVWKSLLSAKTQEINRRVACQAE